MGVWHCKAQSSMHFSVMMTMHSYCEGRRVRRWASEEAIEEEEDMEKKHEQEGGSKNSRQ